MPPAMSPLIPYFDAGSVTLFGSVTLKTPGLLLVSGAIVGAGVALLKARRDRLQIDVLLSFFPWFFAALIVGSHLGDVLLYTPGWLRERPLTLFEIWTGESSVGAMLAAALVGIVYFRRIERDLRYPSFSREDSWRYADALVYGSTLGWVVGRLGCFAVHDHPGTETDFWLGVYGICPGGRSDIACHDLGLYEAILVLGFFAILKVLDKTPRPAGFFVAVMALAYGITRLLLDMLRHPLGDTRYFGLTPAQYGSMALIVLGTWILMTRVARSTRGLGPE